MITTALSELKDHLSSYVKKSAKEEVLITNHGRPVGVLKGFSDEDEYLEYRLLNDPRFQKIVERSRREARRKIFYGKSRSAQERVASIFLAEFLKVLFVAAAICAVFIWIEIHFFSFVGTYLATVLVYGMAMVMPVFGVHVKPIIKQ